MHPNLPNQIIAILWLYRTNNVYAGDFNLDRRYVKEWVIEVVLSVNGRTFTHGLEKKISLEKKAKLSGVMLIVHSD